MEAKSTQTVILSMLDGLAATGAPFDTPTLILISADFTPGPTLAMADVTEADFTGYAAKAALVANSAYIDPDGVYRVSFPSQHFEASGSTVSNQIYGWALVNAAKTTLYAAAKLDAPVLISAADQGIDVLPSLAYGN